jgi:hypothetical protein
MPGWGLSAINIFTAGAFPYHLKNNKLGVLYLRRLGILCVYYRT